MTDSTTLAAVERLSLDLSAIDDQVNALRVRVCEEDTDNWSVRYLGDMAKDIRTVLSALSATPPAAPSLPDPDLAGTALYLLKGNATIGSFGFDHEGRHVRLIARYEPLADRVAGNVGNADAPPLTIQVEFDRATGDLKNPAPPPAVAEQTGREG